ncbi:acyl-CoA N-acyltransferase [Pleomassaria siparia CBS 279.74]|uniref:Acyl-CoA N-acyltransferase n=1 Tax=Pleomassaria siparia CBS 279.74 TaxID=1314801 RepID=A0A6G1JY34_9PLEO|nr:acyl-CoA N-acyltransferase [Pleomassaria siparia CBS 279.74]
MPRALESEKATLEGMAPLEKGPPVQPSLVSPHHDDPLPLYRIPSLLVEESFEKMKDLKPFSLLLNQEDVEECDWLEHLAFDSIEAASREKIEYRLAVCGELCSGIFSSAYTTTSTPLGALIRSRKFPSIDSSDSDRKRILLGHIIATKHRHRTVTDDSMDFPSNWRTKYQLSPSTGHDEDGETVCLHSLAVHPDFQNQGLGKVLLLSWVQRIRDSGTGKRIALLCRERLVPFYERSGFKSLGPSKAQYGGGGWVDMIMEFGQDRNDDGF